MLEEKPLAIGTYVRVRHGKPETVRKHPRRKWGIVKRRAWELSRKKPKD